MLRAALLLSLGLCAACAPCHPQSRGAPVGGGTSTPADASAPSSMNSSPTPPGDLERLAAELRQLRKAPGHFSTPPGPFNPEVDAPGGRKYQVMAELGRRLGDGTHSKREIVELLGPPDETARPGDALYVMALGERPAGAPDELLIYFWRGTHDFLFFSCKGPTAVSATWWYAGE